MASGAPNRCTLPLLEPVAGKADAYLVDWSCAAAALRGVHTYELELRGAGRDAVARQQWQNRYRGPIPQV